MKFLIWLAFLPPLAQATLGQKIGAQIKSFSTQRSPLTNQQIKFQTSTEGPNAIREYINDDGVVFAVSWNGLNMPALDLLLGVHFTEFKIAAAMQSQNKGRRSFNVEGPNIEVHTFGHMRDIRGIAFIKSLLPAGLKWEELQ